ncbi:MAG: nitroreductase [Holophagaceae bacterium]|nr:nitroreductase [Holophagaceae bacterium]
MNLFDLPTEAETAAIDAAITTRQSMRAYLPTPVSRHAVAEILRVASRAPSGTNTQPWQVHVLMGAARQRVSDRICAIFEDPAELATHTDEYDYYPKEWVSPYVDRRRKIGWDLYRLLDIAKGDKDRIHRQHARNYRFFDAPVGLIFTIDRIMQQGSWLDYGMFLENIMVAARARGLHTCPQAAFTQFHRVLAEELALRPEQMVVCGMALGHADPTAVENSLVTDRVPVEEFAQFHED